MTTHRLTAAQEEAIHTYTGAGYNSINGKLRGVENIVSPHTQSEIKRLDEVMKHSKLDEMTVWRGMTTDALGVSKDDMLEHRGALDWGKFVGTEWVDKGFVSTTKREEFAEAWQRGIIAEIHVPAGLHGYDVDGAKMSVFDSGEREVLLDRNTHFRITGIDIKDNPTFGSAYAKWSMPVFKVEAYQT